MIDPEEGFVPESQDDPEDAPPSEVEDRSKSRSVPYARFAQVVARLHEATEKLNRTLETQGTQKAEQSPQERTFSPAELRAKVDSGELTPEDAESIREAQLTKRVVKEVVGATQQHSREQVWAAELAEYENAVPALKDPSSDEFVRVADEYKHLVEALGHPTGLNTMLTATRGVYGPIKALKAPAGSRMKAEPHADVGGGFEAPPGGGSKGTPALTVRQKEYYRRAIDRGAYRNWDEVYDEVRAAEKRKRA